MTGSGVASNLAKKILDFLSGASLFLSSAMLVLMLAIMVIGVVSRYAFNKPLVFVDEYVMYLMVGVSLLAANYVLKEDGHISVDIITRLLSQKARAWLLVVTDFISIFLVMIILIQVSRLASISMATGTVSNTSLRTPIGPIQLLLPITFTLLLLEFLRSTVLSIKSAISMSKS